MAVADFGFGADTVERRFAAVVSVAQVGDRALGAVGARDAIAGADAWFVASANLGPGQALRSAKRGQDRPRGQRQNDQDAAHEKAAPALWT